jgi:hypothetical protein
MRAVVIETAHRSCGKTSSEKTRTPVALVYGIASLPLGAPVELEIMFEVGDKT